MQCGELVDYINKISERETMSCMHIYKEHVDKAGMDQACFQVNDRTIKCTRGDMTRNYLSFSHFLRSAPQVLRPAPLNANELIFAHIFSVPVFTGLQASSSCCWSSSPLDTTSPEDVVSMSAQRSALIRPAGPAGEVSVPISK